MILVDTSVVIAYQRNADPNLAMLFRTLPVALCGITRAEVLHGARNTAERAIVMILLNAFLPLSIADAVWDLVGEGVIAPFQRFRRESGMLLTVGGRKVCWLGRVFSGG